MNIFLLISEYFSILIPFMIFLLITATISFLFFLKKKVEQYIKYKERIARSLEEIAYNTKKSNN